jgi:hypothetical protein
MNGDSVIAPGAPVVLGWWARAFQIISDLLIAVGLIWALPVAVAIVIAIARLLAGALR